jgi:hypothetical protein
MAKNTESAPEPNRNAPTQVEKRREYVAEHPEEDQILNERERPPIPVHPLAVALGAVPTEEPAHAHTAPTSATSSAASADTGSGEAKSEVADLGADEAVDSISRFRSREKLQAIADSDKRKSVQEAARKRLEELGE